MILIMLHKLQYYIIVYFNKIILYSINDNNNIFCSELDPGQFSKDVRNNVQNLNAWFSVNILSLNYVNQNNLYAFYQLLSKIKCKNQQETLIIHLQQSSLCVVISN